MVRHNGTNETDCIELKLESLSPSGPHALGNTQDGVWKYVGIGRIRHSFLDKVDCKLMASPSFA